MRRRRLFVRHSLSVVFRSRRSREVRLELDEENEKSSGRREEDVGGTAERGEGNGVGGGDANHSIHKAGQRRYSLWGSQLTVTSLKVTKNCFSDSYCIQSCPVPRG